MGKGGSHTPTCTRPARCWAVTTTAGRVDSVFRSSQAGWPVASQHRGYEKEPPVPSHRPVGFADGPAHLPADWISRRISPGHIVWAWGPSHGRVKPGRPGRAGASDMREEL